jgi:hypothetical protein
LVLALVLGESSLGGYPPVHIITTITATTNHQTSQPTDQTDRPHHGDVSSALLWPALPVPAGRVAVSTVGLPAVTLWLLMVVYYQ